MKKLIKEYSASMTLDNSVFDYNTFLEHICNT